MYTGKDIKELRQKYGLSQKEFADELNTTIYTIRNWEQNLNKNVQTKYDDKIEQFIKDEDERVVKKELNNKMRNVKHLFLDFIEDVRALYECALDPETPFYKKSIIFAAIAYFIFPIDAIPDMIPVLGYIDDAGIIGAAIATIGSAIKAKHRKVAGEWMNNKKNWDE